MAKYLIKLYDQDYRQAEAAYNYFFKDQTNNISEKDYFWGYLAAFFYKDFKQHIENEINAETQSLMDLRTRFSQELDELHNEYLLRKSEINSSYESLTNEITKWKGQTQESISSFLTEKTQKMKELEKVYEEKLRLESPAVYWQNLSDEYRKKGDNWRTWAVRSSIIFVLFLTVILYNIPQTLIGHYDFNSVKATIIFALIASIGIYIIRLFIMLSTSAYHLSTDANERSQLKYVYISLLNEKAATDADRSIVLQSIFSRAETGLLKGDSSPTLPDGVISQIFKNIKSK